MIQKKNKILIPIVMFLDLALSIAFTVAIVQKGWELGFLIPIIVMTGSWVLLIYLIYITINLANLNGQILGLDEAEKIFRGVLNVK